jgi:deoxyribonuclease V
MSARSAEARLKANGGGTATEVGLLIACVDVDYRDGGAVAAGIWFRGWTADAAEHQVVAAFSEVAEYEPGAFYRRELPCILGVLARGPAADVVIVDGYVWLADRSPGLGARLHELRGGVVVGVAKTRYASAVAAVEVHRGSSRSPLFVSAVGMSADEAAAGVASMHGSYRVPTLLKQVDALARRSNPDR